MNGYEMFLIIAIFTIGGIAFGYFIEKSKFKKEIPVSIPHDISPVIEEKKYQIQELKTLVRLTPGLPFNVIDDIAIKQLNDNIKPFFNKEQLPNSYGEHAPIEYQVTLKLISPV